MFVTPKIFLQKQKDYDFYMLPGGRVEIYEDSLSAIKRELKEELGINEEVYLKYILENFITFPDEKYHEIGFYFITKIDEKKYNYFFNEEYNSKDEVNDGKSKFRWIDKDEINTIKIMPNVIKKKLFINDASNKIEHIIYME